jgi:hypothetical protein
LVARYRVPTVYPFRIFAEVGGLVSYGSSALDEFRRAASYADRILKGAKPSELPVQTPINFDLVVNLKTAKMAREIARLEAAVTELIAKIPEPPAQPSVAPARKPTPVPPSSRAPIAQPSSRTPIPPRQ